MSEDGRYPYRSDLLNEAEKIITQDRNKSYGEPDEDFRRIAAIASALGFRFTSDGDVHGFLQGHHVAMFMQCLKLSRLAWMPTHRDSWLDSAGYAACGYETAMLQLEREREEVLTAKPTLVALIPGDLLDAAYKACCGDPSDLEEMGYFLGNASDGTNACSAMCGNGQHAFRPGCAYRIKKRRDDG